MNCAMCYGSGKNNKNETCPLCEGTGEPPKLKDKFSTDGAIVKQVRKIQKIHSLMQSLIEELECSENPCAAEIGRDLFGNSFAPSEPAAMSIKTLHFPERWEIVAISAPEWGIKRARKIT